MSPVPTSTAPKRPAAPVRAPLVTRPAPAPRRAILAPRLPTGPRPGAARAGAQAPGVPLDGATRRWMEARFGYDFAAVRVHADARAAAAADALQAHAYTVGQHIVFGAGRYQPETRAGRALLAHELAHAVQQRAVPAEPAEAAPAVDAVDDPREQAADAQARAALAGRPLDPPGPALRAPRVQRVWFGQKFWRLIGFEGSFDDDELQEYLRGYPDRNRTEHHFDSDNKAREIVRRWQRADSRYPLPVRRKIVLIREMLTGWVSDDDEAGILALLLGSPDAELTPIFADVSEPYMRGRFGGPGKRQLDVVTAAWRARTGPRPPQDIFAQTHPVTPTEHAEVEATLTPGAHLVPAAPPPPPPPGGAAPPPPPPPVVQGPAAMTGRAPAPGVEGAFEHDMKATLRKYVHDSGAAFRKLRAAGPPAFPIAQANSIAIAAQGQVEAYFAPYIQVASRLPATPYHPGAYSLTAVIHDQSQVPITDAGTGGHPGRIGWTHYWMAQPQAGGPIMSKYHCVPTRSPDNSDFAGVSNRFATDPANRTDIDDTIHSWPAEASAGVNIQPYQTMGSEEERRTTRWDVFTTLLHEMMHVIQHPNFVRTYLAIGGEAEEVLKEGFADVMRHDLWDGPGDLQGRIATDAYTPLRRQVEGGEYDYDASLVQYHPDYPDKYPKARTIVYGGPGIGGGPAVHGVGIANAKAAFFLGHTELLGLGAGTATHHGVSLAGIAQYAPTDSPEAELVEVQPGETYDALQARTNAPAGGIRDQAGHPIAPGAALAAGTKVRVPGVRYVYTIEEDDLGSVARQNNVSVAALARANGLPVGVLAAMHLGGGRRLLIPVHGAGGAP